MSDSVSNTPFRAIAHVRINQSAFIGKDNHYNYHTHITNSKHQPITATSPPFYVDLKLTTSDTTDQLELKTIRSLFVKAMHGGKNPGLPTLLPSYLFEGKKEGEIVSFFWKGYPVELALYQIMDKTPSLEDLDKVYEKQEPLTSHQRKGNSYPANSVPVNFEDVFKMLKTQAEQSLHKIGGFIYPEDVDYNMIRTQVFKNATVYTVDQTNPVSQKGNGELSFIPRPLNNTTPLNEDLWKRFQLLVDNSKPAKRLKKEEEWTPIGPLAGRRFPDGGIFYEKELDGVTQRTYLLSDIWTRRDSLQILVNESFIWLTAETENPLPPGVLDLTNPPFPKYRQELISLSEGILVPSSITAKFINNGEFLLKFQIKKSA